MSGNERDGTLSLRGIMVDYGRSSCLFVILFALSAAIAVPSFAAQATPTTYAQAIDALYNLDFNIAVQTFDRLIAQDQSNPDYWNGLASTIWLKILYDQQKFNLDSYSGSSIGVNNSHDSVNPADEKKLRDTIDEAMKRANAMLAKNPKDVRALYALGVSNATLAAFEGLVKRSYVTALGKAKTARNYHEQVLKIDPNFEDALLSIGTFDYGIGIIPLPLRMVVGVFGISGSGKEEGIHKLEMVAANGNRAATDAKEILIIIYNREHEYDQSLRLIDELLAKYPRNFQLEMSKAAVYGKMKDWTQAIQVYQHILSRIQAKQNGYDRLRPELVYGQLGVADVNQGRSDDAIAAFDKVVGSKSDDNEKADAYLWLGKIYDSLNKREQATQQYNAILKLNCKKQYQDDAHAFLTKPYKG
jgi:tetratricopeptide (TPR) repeat protein